MLKNFLERFGRDHFREALRMANKADSDNLDWKNFKYMVFDIPTYHVTYAERYNRLGTLMFLCVVT